VVLAAGGDLSTDWPLVAIPVVLLVLAAAVLFRVGRPGPGPERWARQAARIPDAIEGLTGIPGWAGAVVGGGLFSVAVSLVGFYTDVAWHIQFGRDKTLWTPPHVLIVAGLTIVSLSAVFGIVFATVTGARVGFRWGRWQVPWSVLPLAAFGTASAIGFPLDDLWHAAYGVDVTLWSPTHILLVAAATFSTVSLWLTLREAGVGARPGAGFWPVATYWVLAGATLARLTTLHAEFDLGVPQFQQLFHPVIVSLAAGAGLVAARMLLGRGGAVVMVVGFLVLRSLLGAFVGAGLGYLVPHFPLFLFSALGVEAVAARWGIERQGRYAVACGVAIGTVGLAGEWWWSQVWGRYAWGAPLFPEAVLVGLLAAVGAAVIGAAAGAAAGGHPIRLPGRAVAAAGVAVLVALVIPSPRTGLEAAGNITLERRGDQAVVRVALDPPTAATGAHWFEVLAWQGGDLVNAPMVGEGEGRYRSNRAVPITGNWKTVVRLHEGTILTGLPVYLPADPEIDAPLIPAVDGRRDFVLDTSLMMREAKPGSATVRVIVYALIAATAATSLTVLAFSARRLQRHPTPPSARPTARSSAQPAT
jgi:hypothetical protein